MDESTAVVYLKILLWIAMLSVIPKEHGGRSDNVNCVKAWTQCQTRQSRSADSAPGVATCRVTLSTRRFCVAIRGNIMCKRDVMNILFQGSCKCPLLCAALLSALSSSCCLFDMFFRHIKWWKCSRDQWTRGVTGSTCSGQFVFSSRAVNDVTIIRLQCFDAVGWVAGRASGL